MSSAIERSSREDDAVPRIHSAAEKPGPNELSILRRRLEAFVDLLPKECAAAKRQMAKPRFTHAMLIVPDPMDSGQTLKACLQKQLDPIWVQISPKQRDNNAMVNTEVMRGAIGLMATTTTKLEAHAHNSTSSRQDQQILSEKGSRMNRASGNTNKEEKDSNFVVSIKQEQQQQINGSSSFDAIAEAVRILHAASQMLDDCLHRIGGSSPEIEQKQQQRYGQPVNMDWGMESEKGNGSGAVSSEPRAHKNECQKQPAQQNGQCQRPKYLLLSGEIHFPSELRKYKNPTPAN